MTWPGLPFPGAGQLIWVIGLLLLSPALRALPRLLDRLTAAFEECPTCRALLRKGQETCHHCLRAVQPRARP